MNLNPIGLCRLFSYIGILPLNYMQFSFECRVGASHGSCVCIPLPPVLSGVNCNSSPSAPFATLFTLLTVCVGRAECCCLCWCCQSIRHLPLAQSACSPPPAHVTHRYYFHCTHGVRYTLLLCLAFWLQLYAVTSV